MRKTKNTAWICLLFSWWFCVSLNAGDDHERHNVSLSGHLICLLIENDGIIGAGLNLEFRVSPQVGFGVDLNSGVDSDGQGYVFLLPAVTYHFKLKSKKSDLFAGVGFNAIIKRDDSINTYFGSSLLAFAGGRLFFSPHFGGQFRIFVSDRIFGGFSLGCTYNF